MPIPATCFLCGDPITPNNNSREHIIANALGGRLKVWGFLCQGCNNTAGHQWDADLAADLNPLCLFFGIAREEGMNPAMAVVTTAGERLHLTPGGGLRLSDPSYRETDTPEGRRLEFSARDTAEARRILRGVKRKYPQVNTEALLQQATPVTSYPEGAVKFSFAISRPNSGRALVKSAAAFAAHLGVPGAACDLALAYLKNGGEPCFGYYHERDLVAGRPTGLPIHVVAVSGDPATGLLLAYVEFFAGLRMVVCLSQSYTGAKVEGTHAINPMTGEEIVVSVKLPFDREDIAAIYRYERISDSAMAAAFAPVLDAAMKRQREAEMHRVAGDAADYALANCGLKPGDLITPEYAGKIAALFTERMQPYILRGIQKRRKTP